MTLTTANIITLSRLFLAPIFLVFSLSESAIGVTVAVIIFAVAAASDWLDGAVARTYSEVTSYGAYLDPLADKVLTSSAFVAFFMLDVMPLWMVLVIIIRDFGTTALRSIAEDRGQPLVTSWHAKVKTFLQMLFIVYLLVLLWGAYNLEPPTAMKMWRLLYAESTYWMMAALTAFTVWTLGEYLYANRQLLGRRADHGA